MNRLDTLLSKGFVKWVEVEKQLTPDSNGCFRGGNITMLEDDDWLAEDSSNCPRSAIARMWGFAEPRNTSTVLSNQVGRHFEDVFEKALRLGGGEALKLTTEEQEQITVDFDGVVRYTQRPDGIVVDPGSVDPFAVELKSVQSGNTAEMVFHNSTPKLGAAMQLGGVMLHKDLYRGFVVYGLSSYLSHYSYKQKKKLSFQPAIKTFECGWAHNEVLTVDGRKTIVKKSSMISGLFRLTQTVDKDLELPARPKWSNVWGDQAKYSGCEYCQWKECCAALDAQKDLTLNGFREQLLQMEVDI